MVIIVQYIQLHSVLGYNIRDWICIFHNCNDSVYLYFLVFVLSHATGHIVTGKSFNLEKQKLKGVLQELESALWCPGGTSRRAAKCPVSVTVPGIFPFDSSISTCYALFHVD